MFRPVTLLVAVALSVCACARSHEIVLVGADATVPPLADAAPPISRGELVLPPAPMLAVSRSSAGSFRVTELSPEGRRVLTTFPRLDGLVHAWIRRSPADETALIVLGRGYDYSGLFLVDLVNGDHQEVSLSPTCNGNLSQVIWEPSGNGFWFTCLKDGGNTLHYASRNLNVSVLYENHSDFFLENPLTAVVATRNGQYRRVHSDGTIEPVELFYGTGPFDVEQQTYLFFDTFEDPPVFGWLDYAGNTLVEAPYPESDGSRTGSVHMQEKRWILGLEIDQPCFDFRVIDLSIDAFGAEELIGPGCEPIRSRYDWFAASESESAIHARGPYFVVNLATGDRIEVKPLLHSLGTFHPNLPYAVGAEYADGGPGDLLIDLENGDLLGPLLDEPVRAIAWLDRPEP